MIKNSHDAAELLKERCAGKNIVMLWCIFCDGNNAVLQVDKFGMGNVEMCEMNKRAIIRRALNLDATSVVAATNMPSGNVYPSQEVIECCKKLRECCQLFEMDLMDFLVFGKDRYYSFYEEETYKL